MPTHARGAILDQMLLAPELDPKATINITNNYGSDHSVVIIAVDTPQLRLPLTSSTKFSYKCVPMIESHKIHPFISFLNTTLPNQFLDVRV